MIPFYCDSHGSNNIIIILFEEIVEFFNVYFYMIRTLDVGFVDKANFFSRLVLDGFYCNTLQRYILFYNSAKK